ncbi:MAG: hypothetical protein ACXAAH_15500 [Promethearchaeota archaeon]|jgi:hypothetical protein
MIKRATILKHLKHHGKYERRHFTMKKVELENECKKLGIDLTQNIDDQTVKAPVKPKKVEIQEPDSSDESSDDETSDEETESQVPQTPLPSPKKLKRKQTIQKVEKVEQKVEPDNSKKKAVTEILKDLNSVVLELFSEFDKNSIDNVDAEYIRTEFSLILNEAQDLIDPLVTEFSDAEIQKIENRIDLQYRKLERFLS